MYVCIYIYTYPSYYTPPFIGSFPAGQDCLRWFLSISWMRSKSPTWHPKIFMVKSACSSHGIPMEFSMMPPFFMEQKTPCSSHSIPLILMSSHTKSQKKIPFLCPLNSPVVPMKLPEFPITSHGIPVWDHPAPPDGWLSWLSNSGAGAAQTPPRAPFCPTFRLDGKKAHS